MPSRFARLTVNHVNDANFDMPQANEILGVWDKDEELK